MSIKSGDILYCIKDNYYDGRWFAAVGQLFIVSEILDNNCCRIKIFDSKGKDKCVVEGYTKWYYKKDGLVRHSSTEYLWDYFEDKKIRAKRIINDFTNSGTKDRT